MIDWSGVRDPNFREVPPKLGTMGLAMATLAFVLAFVTVSDYGIVSDVANYYESSRRQLEWLRGLIGELVAGHPTRALERDTVFEVWRWRPKRLPHPPVARELSGLTWLATHRFIDTLTAYRLAVMLAYAALVGWVTVFTYWAVRSRTAGLTAGMAVMAYPALFAHGHLAHTDLFLTTFWFASAASLVVFERTRRIGWLVVAGLLFGGAAASKFSGLLLGPVIVAWLVIRRPREALPALVVLVLAAVAVFVSVNPVLWVAPDVGLADYFGSGLDRAGEAMAQIRTEYFGSMYVFRPPLHYPWLWTLIVLPPTFLIALVAGVWVCRRHWIVSFCLLNMGVLYAALLLPRAPMHDGVRLFLPVLAFQCVLVGVGAQRIGERLSSRFPSAERNRIAALVAIAILAPAAAVNVQSHPFQLSYANFLIGGTAGAETKGLEVTNLKEVFSPAVISDLDGLIPSGAVVDPGFLTEELCFYRSQGLTRDWVVEKWLPVGETGGVTLSCAPDELLPRVLARPARDPDFVIVLNRKAMWRPSDRALFEFGGGPIYELSYDGVPLLRAYRLR